MAGVPASLIEINHDLRLRIASPYRHQTRVQYDVLGESGLHAPTDRSCEKTDPEQRPNRAKPDASECR